MPIFSDLRVVWSSFFLQWIELCWENTLDTLNVVVWLLENFLEARKIKFSLKSSTFWRVWPEYSETSTPKKIWFSDFYANIFWSTFHLVFIFSSVDRAMLREHVRYLESGCMTSKIFLEAWKFKFSLKNIHFLGFEVWSNPSKSAVFPWKLDFPCL